MGCGNSHAQEIQKKKLPASSDDLAYETIMDKKIPNYFIEDTATENNVTDDDSKMDQKTDNNAV